MAFNNHEFWLSEQGYPCRCADYLFHMLKQNPGRKTEEMRSGSSPDWPAIWGYDPQIDALLWVEIRAAVHIKDYQRAYPDQVNAAALALVT